MAHGIQQADVCIICALEKEAHAVEQVISERCKVTFVANVIRDSHFAYRSTTITNTKGERLTLALLCQTRPGPVSAAFNLGALLEKFQPCFVGMSGICAGDKRHMHLGDLVVAEHAYHFEEGKVTRDEQGRVLHQPEGIPYAPTEQVLQYVRTFAGWSTPVAELKKHLLGSDEPPQRVMTLMASGMAVRSDDPFESLQRQHRKTWALDMEAASLYLALRANPFVNGLVVKGVADYADLSKDDTFHDFAARASAIYVLTFIQEYVTTNALLRRRNPAVFAVPSSRNASEDNELSGKDIAEKLPSHFGPNSQVTVEPGKQARLPSEIDSRHGLHMLTLSLAIKKPNYRGIKGMNKPLEPTDTPACKLFVAITAKDMSKGCLVSVYPLKVKTYRWLDREQPHPFQIHATPATKRMALTKNAELVNRALIPNWLLLLVAPLLAVALILLLVLAVLIPRTSNPVVVSRPTAIPTATPTIDPNSPAGILAQATAGPPTFSDSLAKSDTNWDNNQNCMFTQGSYQVTKGDSNATVFVSCAERAIQFSHNLAYEVQMTIIQGDEGGIFFRDDQSQHFDALIVNENGNYIFAGNSRPSGSISSTAINKGLNQTNWLTVVTRNNQVYVYMNNQFVNSFNNQGANGSYIGVVALDVSNPTIVQYRNVQIWTLS